VAWVSDTAREIWRPRLAKIETAWSWIEWLAIPAGIRPCALTRLSPDAYVSAAAVWAEENLCSLPLETTNPARRAGATTVEPAVMTVVVGALRDIRRFRVAWLAKNYDRVAALLGYPPCCRGSFRKTQSDSTLDPTWAIAAETLKLTPLDRSVEISASTSTNVLWRWMGVRAVPHLPCRFDCRDTARLAEQYRALGVRAGARQEMEWSDDILSWPAEWSALHGIAEIKTPILRVSTRTDATAEKYVVRWKSKTYPPEGAQGVNFPYKASPHHSTVSEAFQLGLKRISVVEPPRPAWYHLDNGFSSAEAMEGHHSPVVALARRQLSGVSGMILDLGCGNGALLRRICEGRDDLAPHGIDTNGSALDHARETLPFAAANFSRANIFKPEAWSGGRRYALVIVSLRRLLEVSRLQADELLANIRKHSDRLVVYEYSDARAQRLQELAARVGLHLTETTGDIAGVVSLERLGAGARVDDEPIDWSRVAQPQADGYDTDVVFRLRAATAPPAGVHDDRSTAAPTLFGGRVVVVNRLEGGLRGRGFRPARCDHPNLGRAAEYLNAWPEVALQFPRLVSTIQPWNDTSRTPEQWLANPGSSSHSLEEEFGTIMATVDSPIGLANAMVHEMAHHKLRALGVSILTATRLITNDPREEYFSPIKGRKRPLTAVLHAQYSFIHVVCLECALQSSDHLSVDEKRKARERFSWHVSSMERGYGELERHARTDADGAVFLDAFMKWSREVLQRAKDILAANGGALPTSHQ
jgi:hypothetical protein